VSLSRECLKNGHCRRGIQLSIVSGEDSGGTWTQSWRWKVGKVPSCVNFWRKVVIESSLWVRNIFPSKIGSVRHSPEMEIRTFIETPWKLHPGRRYSFLKNLDIADILDALCKASWKWYMCPTSPGFLRVSLIASEVTTQENRCILWKPLFLATIQS
jgi:hypothetical protein